VHSTQGPLSLVEADVALCDGGCEPTRAEFFRAKTAGGTLRDEGLHLVVSNVADWESGGGGVHLRAESRVVSRGSAASLASILNRSNAFTIEAVVRPDELAQFGPARIAGISRNSRARNFTLAQQGSEWIWRVRNGVNGPNGSNHQLIGGSVLLEWQHIVAIYDHGLSTLFHNGCLVSRSIDLRETPVHLFLGTNLVGLIVFGLFLAFGMGLTLVSILLRFVAAKGAFLAAFALCLAGGLIPYFISCAVIGGPLHLRQLICVLITVGAVLMLTLRWRTDPVVIERILPQGAEK
jgi:hypothetical protein